MKGKWFLLLGLIAVALVAGSAPPASAEPKKCLICEKPPIEEPKQTLTITINGSGYVQEATFPYCSHLTETGGSKTCERKISEGEIVGLDAYPGTGFSFIGWSGDCSGTGVCAVIMDQARAVTATFVDDTPPSVPTISSPSADQVFEWTAEEAASVSFDSSGDSSATSFLCSVDISFGGVDCSSPWSTGNLAAGQHTVYVWAKDAAGNISSPASRGFEVVIVALGGGEEEAPADEESGDSPGGGSGEGGGTSGGTGGSGFIAPIALEQASPKIAALLVKRWKLQGDATLLRELALKGLPAGAEVVVTCSGKGCPFKRKQPKVAGGAANLNALFANHELGPGALVELKVSAPGMTGQTIDLKIRAGKAPKVTKR